MQRLKYYYELEELCREIVNIIGSEDMLSVNYVATLDIDRIITDYERIYFAIKVKSKSFGITQKEVDSIKYLLRGYDNPLFVRLPKWDTIDNDLISYETYKDVLIISNGKIHYRDSTS